MGGHNLCIPRCKNNENETKPLISKVLDTQWRGEACREKHWEE